MKKQLVLAAALAAVVFQSVAANTARHVQLQPLPGDLGWDEPHGRSVNAQDLTAQR